MTRSLAGRHQFLVVEQPGGDAVPGKVGQRLVAEARHRPATVQQRLESLRVSVSDGLGRLAVRSGRVPGAAWLAGLWPRSASVTASISAAVICQRRAIASISTLGSKCHECVPFLELGGRGDVSCQDHGEHQPSAAMAFAGRRTDAVSASCTDHHTPRWPRTQRPVASGQTSTTSSSPVTVPSRLPANAVSRQPQPAATVEAGHSQP